MDTLIDGVLLTPLKKISNPRGDVFRGLRKSEEGFAGFAEAYFSTVLSTDIKPWKKHREMTLQLIVPVGEVRFVLYDDRPYSPTKGMFNEFRLSPDRHYARLTVPPNVWMAFTGLSKDLNLLLNVANLEHDPAEVDRLDLKDIPYSW